MYSLRELQMLAEVEYSVEDTRKDLNRVVEFFKSKDYHDEAIKVAFVEARDLSRDIADDADVFFVDDSTLLEELPEELLAESIGLVRNNYLVFEGRLVYPVKDVRGNVMGFCGWDKFAKPKYLDSKNHGYKAKSSTFYGMEKLPEYYRSGKPIYVVEGIVCCLYLRSIGLQAIALLGSSITPYVLEILKRIQGRLVIIPDNDIIGKEIEDINETKPAGEHLVEQASKYLPRAIVIQSAIEKDVDDSRKLDNHKYEDEFVRDIISVALNPYIPVKTIRVRQIGAINKQIKLQCYKIDAY